MRFAYVLANSGNLLILVILLIIFYLWFRIKNQQLILVAFISGGISWIISFLIKNFFYVPRPYIVSGRTPLVNYLLDGSFPSQHTALAFGLAFYIFLYYRKIGALLLLISVIVSVSRVVAGVHTPTDILGGFSVGLIVALLLKKIQD